MRILPMVCAAVFVLVTSSVLAQAPPRPPSSDGRAVVGNSAGGGGGSGQAERDRSLERANAIAKESGRQAPTVEQLLLALLDDDGVRDALASQYVDVGSLRATVTQYVADQPRVEPTPTDPFGRDPKLAPVLQRAMMKAVADNRHPLATDLLTAILVEGDSFAAEALANYGLTVQEAENAAVEHYLAVQKEANARLADTQRRIAAVSKSSNEGLQIEAAEVRTSSGPVDARDYTLRITSGGPTAIRFKAAVSHDGALELYVESTPFETRFSGRQVVALFEAVERGSLRAELLANVDGVTRIIGSTGGGEAGAIFDDLYQRGSQSSGLLR
jgi:hypothetical protein